MMMKVFGYRIPARLNIFSCANSVLAGIILTNALHEKRQLSLQNMFISCPFNSVVIQHFPSKYAHVCIVAHVLKVTLIKLLLLF